MNNVYFVNLFNNPRAFYLGSNLFDNIKQAVLLILYFNDKKLAVTIFI